MHCSNILGDIGMRNPTCQGESVCKAIFLNESFNVLKLLPFTYHHEVQIVSFREHLWGTLQDSIDPPQPFEDANKSNDDLSPQSILITDLFTIHLAVEFL